MKVIKESISTTDLSYEKFISNIINTRGQWSDEVYNSTLGCEMHHIIPACMGGEGDFIYNRRSVFKKHSHHPNCIYLYPGEHFIAHKLLYEEHPDQYGLYAAWLGTTKNGLVDMDDYISLKEYNHTLPKEILEKIKQAGQFHYKTRKETQPVKDTTKYKLEQARRRELGIQGNYGRTNGMYQKGYKISNGNNGHASIRYFYKDKIFESRKELLNYLHSIGSNITSSAIRAVIHGTGTLRVYNMYKDIFDNLSWEYKE